MTLRPERIDEVDERSMTPLETLIPQFPAATRCDVARALPPHVQQVSSMTAPRQKRRVLTSIPAVSQGWSLGTARVTIEAVAESFATCHRHAKSAPPTDPGCHPDRRQQAYQQSHPEQPESHHLDQPESHHPEQPES